ncbi:hypothetical protein [Cryobacterium roopkundense]|uniref:Serine hydrolase FSH domain-containing protein n=2 Tax=Cryobacterium roopkundense TaxID=1001240 RepID=A0A7W9E4A7_9MICO|nr:hypothetical protein [Cryobacterium roopkundense]MBB5642487.1 hypothetical protein [Cryobacterium roopkundense]
MGDDFGAEMMVVGFSQGGFIAQTLADDQSFNIKEVLTYGTPELVGHRNFGGANVVRLMHNGDPVPGFQWLTNNVVTQTTSSILTAVLGEELPEKGSSINFRAGNFDVTSHAPDKYMQIADEYDKSVNSEILSSRSSQQRFHGTVVSDTY